MSACGCRRGTRLANGTAAKTTKCTAPNLLYALHSLTVYSVCPIYKLQTTAGVVVDVIVEDMCVYKA